MTIDYKNKYTQMQQRAYDGDASHWSLENRDPVVGSFDQHNAWNDYDEFLFKNIETQDKYALDFACGPGRNIVKFAERFVNIDGVDISQVNLDKARIWFQANNLSKTPKLYKNNGVDLSDIQSDTYDVVFSTIAMQHICVHEIRFNYLKEFYRVLKSKGHICIQMGFGNHPRSVDYYDNYYDALGTNSFCDTRIDDVNQIKSDLEKIGFLNFNYDIRPIGPGDWHDNWIYFRAQK